MNNRQIVRRVMAKRAYQRGAHLHRLRHASFNHREAALKDIFINYIKNPLVAIKELPRGLVEKSLEEIFSLGIDAIAEKVTDAIREAQIDAHVASFREGFEARDAELTYSDGLAPASSIEELKKHFHDDDYIKGYLFRQPTHTDIDTQNAHRRWTPALQKQITEMGYAEWNDLVEYGYVKRQLIDVLKGMNPWTLLKHLIHTIGKYGIVAGLPIVVSEVLLHFLPIWGSKIIGPKASIIISQIPITELLTPTYIKWVGNSDKNPEEYLDWYEKNYGEIEDVVDEDGKPIPLPERKL